MITQDSQAILLLCGVLGAKDSTSPLSPTEYQRVVDALQARELRPRHLVEDDELAPLIAEDTGIDNERLTTLMRRGMKLSLALEDWESQGIWILTRTDPGYPSLLKRRLSNTAPPLLYGVGLQTRLDRAGIAIVGSRNATPEALEAATSIAKGCALWGVTVVSGGARGVDEKAIRGAIDSGGTALAILPGDLARTTLRQYERDAILDERLTLISPYHPNAGFSTGNAMGRNRLIYCLAHQAVVVSSSVGEGGTWAGATETLKKGWVPVFTLDDGSEGNTALIAAGAKAWNTAFTPGGLALAPATSNSRDPSPRAYSPNESPSMIRDAPDKSLAPVQLEESQADTHQGGQPIPNDAPPASESDLTDQTSDWLLVFTQPRTKPDAAKRLGMAEKKLSPMVTAASKKGLLKKVGKQGHHTVWLLASEEQDELQPVLF